MAARMRGHLVQIVDSSSSRYLCPVCQLLLREPLQAACGDLFCKNCVANLFSESKEPQCPLDHIPLSQNEIFHDVFAERQIQNIKVYCSSRQKSADCSWTGEFRLLKEHEKSCCFVEEKCSNSGCSVVLPRHRMEVHQTSECAMRQEPCRLCDKVITASDTQIHQRMECENYRVCCPNDCSQEKFRRSEVAAHLKTCPNQIYPCGFNHLGCTFKANRCDLQTHENANTAYHLQLTVQAFNASQQQVRDLERRNSALESKYSLLDERMDRFSSILENHFAASAASRNLPPCDIRKVLEPGSKKTTGTLTSSSNPGTSSRSDNESRAMTTRVESLERAIALHDVQMSELTIRQELNEVKATSGVLLWKITDFTRRHREAASGKIPSIYSPPFYTSQAGYKMCARLYLNGDGLGKGTHLSLFFTIMRGEFDTLLSWPFQQRVTLCVLDPNRATSRHVAETFRPDASSSSFHRPQREMNVASGCPCFVPLSSLLSSYVKDDTLFIKIVVHSAGLSAPDDP